MHIVIVNEDAAIAARLCKQVEGSHLQSLMPAVHRFSSAAAASGLLHSSKAGDCIVATSLMLPNEDAIGFVSMASKDMRAGVLAMASDCQARVAALAAGADAALPTSADADELTLTIGAIWRRLVHSSFPARDSSCWRLDLGNFVLQSPEGSDVMLTVHETQLIELLRRGHGRAVSRIRIADELGSLARYSGNALEASVSRLRKKIAQVSPAAQIIKAVNGAGYALGLQVDLAT